MHEHFSPEHVRAASTSWRTRHKFCLHTMTLSHVCRRGQVFGAPRIYHKLSVSRVPPRRWTWWCTKTWCARAHTKNGRNNLCGSQASMGQRELELEREVNKRKRRTNACAYAGDVLGHKAQRAEQRKHALAYHTLAAARTSTAAGALCV